MQSFYRLLNVRERRAMADLVSWSIIHPNRRFTIQWKGPVRYTGSSMWSGGWAVCCYTTRTSRRQLHHVSMTLDDAIHDALKARPKTEKMPLKVLEKLYGKLFR